MVRNLDDEIVVPRESSHFGFYRPGQNTAVVNFTETRLFQEDLIGLKMLHDHGKLVFRELPGKHMQLNWWWFRDMVLEYFDE